MKDTFTSISVTFNPLIIEKDKRTFFSDTNIDQAFIRNTKNRKKVIQIKKIF